MKPHVRSNSASPFAAFILCSAELALNLAGGEPTIQAASMVPVQQFESFNSDPSWTGVSNRAVPVPCTRTISNNFGYRAGSTNAGGSQAGEMGGRITRSPTPAYYARVITPKTLNDTLNASGRFAVTQSTSGSGMLFGWFNSTNHQGWRSANSLAFRFDGENGVFRVLFEYGTGTWHAGGTPPLVIGGTNLLPANGTSHVWNFAYEPTGNSGGGRITFVIDGQTFTLDLAAGDRAEGAVFNRFGMFGQQNGGGHLSAFFDDLMIDGVPENFSANPGWEAVRNNGTFTDCEVNPWHNFGYSPTARAGGAAGEIGGLMWRTETNTPTTAAHYGAVVPAMDLNTELKSAGKVALTRAASDSAVLIGWFNAATAAGEAPPRNFMGILIEGPSRVGFYFRGAYNNSTGQRRIQDTGPNILPDGAPLDWTCHYSPDGNNGLGSLTVTLDGQAVTLNLLAGVRTGGATFNRFGLVNFRAGGHFMEAWFDNLSYTTLEPDTDGDGIPDAWETANGFNPNDPADGGADADGDGQPNREEFLAGTDPRDPASALRIRTVERVGADVRVLFSSILGRQYSFERRDAPETGPWTVVQNYVPGTGGDVTVFDPGAAVQTNRIYRVRLFP